MKNNEKNELEYLDPNGNITQYYTRILTKMEEDLKYIKCENDKDEKIVRAIAVLAESLEKSDKHSIPSQAESNAAH